MPKYNYQKLRGKIIEVFGNTNEFCKQMGVCPATLSKKMNNHVYFTQPEMSKALGLLHVDIAEVKDYFFS